MREYKQLTEEDRIEIYAMKQAGKQHIIAAPLFPNQGNRMKYFFDNHDCFFWKNRDRKNRDRGSVEKAP